MFIILLKYNWTRANLIFHFFHKIKCTLAFGSFKKYLKLEINIF